MSDAHQTSWRCYVEQDLAPYPESTNPLVQLGIMDFVNLCLRVITGQVFSSCFLHNGSFSK